MAVSPHRKRVRSLIMGTALVALAGCDQLDIDLRNSIPGLDTTEAAKAATQPRPEPDARGVITYPTYQVAVARRGDTVGDIAARLGFAPDELAKFNGISPSAKLRPGEIIALPRDIGAGAGTTGQNSDLAAISGAAIERAGEQNSPPPTTRVIEGEEPVRHKVERGETAYSIARLYNVSVRALADWNGLGPELEVREGQYLLIPLVAQQSAAPTVSTLPGEGSPTPVPPSAQTALPDEKVAAAKPLPSPDLAQDRSTQARFAMPVSGPIVRGYEKRKNDGVDISASGGAKVVAAEAGTVAAITKDTDQVPILVLRHDDNLLTVYANIDKITVKKGDAIKRGQTIAQVRGGASSFLHFEVRDGFESVDPMPYLN